jgi:DNA-binding CsgD family transcriptional regulator
MRVVLVGTAAGRSRLRERLSDRMEVVGEAATLAAARVAGFDADAWLVVPDGAFDSERSRDDVVGDAELAEALTPREMEVLDLLALGLSNKAIAARLSISDQTVKFHVASICGKLGATNRTDAVRRAFARGLTTL